MTRTFVATVAAIALAVSLPANAGRSRTNVALAQLTAEWWQWVLSIPAPINPLLDSTGDHCMVGQHGSTWFLAGSWLSGPQTLDCDIPQSATLFFPVINMINFDTPNQCTQGGPLPSSTYRALSAEYIAGAFNMSVTLDGKPFGPLQRVQSVVFEISLPDDNIFVGVSPCVAPELTGGVYSPAVDDGFYVRLNPLALGTHTLHIHAEQAPTGGSLDLTYNLNVVPVVTQ
jgi:hypothetical protein